MCIRDSRTADEARFARRVEPTIRLAVGDEHHRRPILLPILLALPAALAVEAAVRSTAT